MENLWKIFRLTLIVWAALAFCGCSSTRHVPQGEYLLDKVTIKVAPEEDSVRIATRQLHNYLRQSPNHKVLGFARLQLGVYNLSGADTTRRFNRWLRKIGEAPVIFDPSLSEQSARQLRLALVNSGYNDARVDLDTASTGRRRMGVTYTLHPGAPHVIGSVRYQVDDPRLEHPVLADSLAFPAQPGKLLDRTMLDNQRALIAEKLRNEGYFAFTKENITFIADTVAGAKSVDLTMVVHNPRIPGESPAPAHSPAAPGSEIRELASQILPPDGSMHRRYLFNRVTVVTDFAPGDNSGGLIFAGRDTVEYHGIDILYGPDRYLTPKALYEQLYIRPGDYYSTTGVDRTYEAFNRLAILRYVNILTRPAGSRGDDILLDAYVLLSRTKKMGVTVELEGTNSEGDFGVGGGITFQHRDLAHAGEVLTAKFRGAYESLSGNLDGLINDNYTEVAGEVGITFPKFEAPFLSSSFKQKMRASTEFALTFMRQQRPEYTRIIAGGAWRYKWADRSNMTRRTFDLVDINIVNLPKSTLNFIDNIAPDNPLLRYSYEDHFIMRMGYTWYHTNRRPASSAFSPEPWQADTYTVRASAETAGALLDAIAAITPWKRKDGAYKIFGIQFAQYLKGEIDYTISHRFSTRNSLNFHVGAGIAFPYGNSSMVPFEKRFYAGGANGVRGWNVRTLGPGRYDSRNSVTDFINQCGDVMLLLNIEYRNKLFWVFEGAVFIDAGNVWTIRDYPNQPGGLFRFNSFYKELAASYGIGLRMDFNYFLLRFDMGVKAHNPGYGQERWPLIHPRWGRDTSFHFSVGYPF
ncbi:MAG: BamA/TamA family outer membrane protein [Muribaculaceae bacterium]|nr:BamA/TamA family outer membrane protein [Muribaculaceae bacterium]